MKKVVILTFMLSFCFCIVSLPNVYSDFNNRIFDSIIGGLHGALFFGYVYYLSKRRTNFIHSKI